MSEGQDSTFQIGLALAGAISAGAYTGGVLDFLFQALDEWEKARGNDGVPAHRVGLKVIAGASAGAITGALGAVALARGLQPQPLCADEIANSYRKEGTKYQSVRCMLPSLYDTWVTRPRMVAKDGGVDLLSDEDLNDPEEQGVRSLLNATLLDEIKKQALLSQKEQPQAKQWPYRYIAETLHVYMTVSNLRGIPFTVEFGNSKYGMQSHGDRVHYTIAGLGSWAGKDGAWAASDTFLPISVATLPEPGSECVVPTEWDEYGTCALASSAFPIGLRGGLENLDRGISGFSA